MFLSRVGCKVPSVQLLTVVINLSHTFGTASLLTHWSQPWGSNGDLCGFNTKHKMHNPPQQNTFDPKIQSFLGWTYLKGANLGARSVFSFFIFKSSHPVI